ncbi:hypothetical protein FGO68_gene15865 [Halteria grandinella]|uniref:HMG box domain-containing protein n=1 Tax=Halteria grandinella TaxID=5974 RepID=A0A8J8NXR0_HALGN|nr:hypothetical protein FGO68_gene15865 [Halteria grandinella]
MAERKRHCMSTFNKNNNRSDQSSSDVLNDEEIKDEPLIMKKGKAILDPVEAGNFFSENLMMDYDDQNFILDATQDLPIRKAQSAYVIFGKLRRDNIMRLNPGINVTEVVKQIAKMWQALTKEDKLKYKEMAKMDKERYLNELKDLTKCGKMLDRPKKPLTPYMLFVRDTRPKVVREFPNIPALDIMKEVGKMWQHISKEELDYFKEKSRRDMERYWSEHEVFINEINDLRAKSGKNQQTQLVIPKSYSEINMDSNPSVNSFSINLVDPALNQEQMRTNRQYQNQSEINKAQHQFKIEKESKRSYHTGADTSQVPLFQCKRRKIIQQQPVSQPNYPLPPLGVQQELLFQQDTPLKCGKGYANSLKAGTPSILQIPGGGLHHNQLLFSRQETTPSTNQDDQMSPQFQGPFSHQRQPISGFLYNYEPTPINYQVQHFDFFNSRQQQPLEKDSNLSPAIFGLKGWSANQKDPQTQLHDSQVKMLLNMVKQPFQGVVDGSQSIEQQESDKQLSDSIGKRSLLRCNDDIFNIPSRSKDEPNYQINLPQQKCVLSEQELALCQQLKQRAEENLRNQNQSMNPPQLSTFQRLVLDQDLSHQNKEHLESNAQVEESSEQNFVPAAHFQGASEPSLNDFNMKQLLLQSPISKPLQIHDSQRTLSPNAQLRINCNPFSPGNQLLDSIRIKSPMQYKSDVRQPRQQQQQLDQQERGDYSQQQDHGQHIGLLQAATQDLMLFHQPSLTRQQQQQIGFSREPSYTDNMQHSEVSPQSPQPQLRQPAAHYPVYHHQLSGLITHQAGGFLPTNQQDDASILSSLGFDHFSSLNKQTLNFNGPSPTFK